MLHRNLIDGEWVEGGSADAEHQPVQHRRRRRRVSPAPTARRREAAIAAAKAAFPAGRARTPQLRYEVAEEDRHRDPGPQGRARPPALARGGQDAARGHRRDRPRRADLRVLRRRGAARRRRDACASVRPGVDVDDHPRAGRRRRHDHALELPDRDPGLEDRAGAGLRQHGRLQARRPRPGLRLGARRHPQPRRPAQGRAQPRHGPRLGGRPGDPRSPGRQRHQLHRLGRHRPQGRRGLHLGRHA